MAKKIDWKWEEVDEATVRVKVMGGWLVRTILKHKNGVSLSTIFIADTDWQWQPVEPLVDPVENRANLAKDYETKPQ